MFIIGLKLQKIRHQTQTDFMVIHNKYTIYYQKIKNYYNFNILNVMGFNVF
jgi:hypothetical protein